MNYTDIDETKGKEEVELNNSELDALDIALKAFDEWVLEEVEKALNEENKNEIK